MSLLFAQTSPALAPGASVGTIHNISLSTKFLETMRFFEEFCGPANYSHLLFHTSAGRLARIFTLSTYKILGASDLREFIVIADDYILQDILRVQIISIRQAAAKD
jgi:hypothetical protein